MQKSTGIGSYGHKDTCTQRSQVSNQDKVHRSHTLPEACLSLTCRFCHQIHYSATITSFSARL